MTTDLWFDLHTHPCAGPTTERHRVVMVEYLHHKAFCAMTTHGRNVYDWSFEWSRRHRSHYYEMAGFCDRFRHIVSKVYPHQPNEIWTVPDFPLVIGTWDNNRPASERKLASLGYTRLKQPRLLAPPLGEKTRNPFDTGDEGSCLYCSICDDWLPKEEWDNPCEHLEWCEGCFGFVYTESRVHVDGFGKCECPRDELNEDEPEAAHAH